jgi:hypothetical protein
LLLQRDWEDLFTEDTLDDLDAVDALLEWGDPTDLGFIPEPADPEQGLCQAAADGTIGG